MLTRPECLLCIIDDLSGALEAEVPDESVRFRILRDALRFLSEGFSPDRTPSYYITEVHRILKRMAEIPVPFAARRDAANRVGMEIARRVEARAAEMDGWERFRLLAAWAIAGNEMDFRTVGTGYAFAEQDLERMYAESLSKLKVDDLREIYARLDTVRCVLCIHDNVGEIALDRALLSDLRRRGIYTISAVRSGPITSDATMDDAQFVGLHDAVDEVILAGPDTLGISSDATSCTAAEASTTDECTGTLSPAIISPGAAVAMLPRWSVSSPIAVSPTGLNGACGTLNVDTAARGGGNAHLLRVTSMRPYSRPAEPSGVGDAVSSKWYALST